MIKHVGWRIERRRRQEVGHARTAKGMATLLLVLIAIVLVLTYFWSQPIGGVVK